MKNNVLMNMKTRMSITFAAILICCSGAMAQPKTLASVIDEAIEFGKVLGVPMHIVELEFSINEGAFTVRNLTPAILSVEQKRHRLGTKEYLTMSPQQYVRGTNTNSVIAGTPKLTSSSPSQTYVASTNSTLISNGNLVDLLTISYKTSSGTTNIGLRNSATVTEGSSDSGIPGVFKRYIISGTIDGKAVRVEIRLTKIIFG
jgi:hypothetical protein